MGKYIPVDPEKWAAMVQAQAENKRLKEHLNSVTETHCINTSMWKDDLNRYREMCDELDAECTRLKAEVERLTAVFVPENLILRADVERLTKAGDWVMSHWSSGDGSDEVRFCQALLKWKNAKEGKQP